MRDPSTPTAAGTWIIVQARTGSSRLPGKALLELSGRPMVDRLLERLERHVERQRRVLTRAEHRIDGIVLATTVLPRDDALEALARARRIVCVRGPESDVLERFRLAADHVNAHTIIRVCADNPLTDPQSIELALEQFHERQLDYLHCFQQVELPYGTGCAVFRRSLLDRACREATTDDEREHVEPWMLAAPGVRRQPFRAPAHLERPDVHLSVDYRSDYEKVRRVFEACHREREDFDTVEVLRELDRCPLVLCANGGLGLQLVRFLVERGEQIRGLVVHPSQQSAQRARIIDASGLGGEDVISPESFDEPWVLDWFRERQPELIASFWSSLLFPQALIDLAPRGVVNLHNALLPWCRGSGGNVWTILDGCPSGVTLHYISEDVDQGPIIDAVEVEVDAVDTGGTLYRKQQAALVDLFVRNWPRLRVGPVRTRTQVGEGSFHYRKSADARRQLDLDRPTTAREVIDLLRAFSFPPYEGVWFEDADGRKVVLNLELSRGIATVREPTASSPAITSATTSATTTTVAPRPSHA